DQVEGGVDGVQAFGALRFHRHVGRAGEILTRLAVAPSGIRHECPPARSRSGSSASAATRGRPLPQNSTASCAPRLRYEKPWLTTLSPMCPPTETPGATRRSRAAPASAPSA